MKVKSKKPNLVDFVNEYKQSLPDSEKYLKPSIACLRFMQFCKQQNVPVFNTELPSDKLIIKPIHSRQQAKRRLQKILIARDYLLSIAKYFYRKGLSKKAEKIFFNVLVKVHKSVSTQFFNNQRELPVKGNTTLKFSEFFKLLITVVDQLNVPIKLVPRFIKARVRKIPTYAPYRFQQARTWRALSLVGKTVFGSSVKSISAEVLKLFGKQKTMVVFKHLVKMQKDIEKGRVYLRFPRVSYKNYKKLLHNVKVEKKNKFPEHLWANKYFCNVLVYFRRKYELSIPGVIEAKQKKLRKLLFKNKLFAPIMIRYFSLIYNQQKLPLKLESV